MAFELPTPDRTRLDELLGILGNRTDDFKKCFDICSEWCYKYADLVMRGMEERGLQYAEEHHIVPASFYGKRTKTVDGGNLTVLTFSEHIYAHYCAAMCGIDKMKGKMAMAFNLMYHRTPNNTITTSYNEILEYINEGDCDRIRMNRPDTVRLEAAGRPHKWEGDYIYNKGYREANKDRIRASQKLYYDANKEILCDYQKKYRSEHEEELKSYRQTRYENNKEFFRERNREQYHKHKIKRGVYNKTYRSEHRDEFIEYQRKYREEKRLAGYCFRKDPLTGKRTWIFVGIPKMDSEI